MGRPKGISTPRRNWSKEEKLKAVNRVLNINSGLLHAWIKKYLENGKKGLENKIKPGNPLIKYSNKKI